MALRPGALLLATPLRPGALLLARPLRPGALLVATALLLGGCAGSRGPLLDELAGAPPAGRPRWPPPPAEARIEYLGSIEREGTFGGRSWLRRIASFVTGAGERHFVRPAALCVLGSRLAVADPGAGAVHLLDLVDRSWTMIERADDGWLRSPVGVACLPDGGIAVSDSLLGALLLYGPDGKPRGRLASVLERPTGVTFDAATGRLWVAETTAHRLRVFDLEGTGLLRVGERGSGAQQFNYPTQLAPDPAGGVWVTDSLNFRLQHVDGGGRIDRGFGTAGDRPGSFARPRGLAVDARGRVFSVDALLDSVQIFDPEGRLLLVFGGRGIGPGRLWLPADVALDATGHVFVADSYNHRVQIFAYRPPGAS
jgi:sugar lactone lactonase YvrE